MREIRVQRFLSPKGKRGKSKTRSTDEEPAEEPAALPLHCWRVFSSSPLASNNRNGSSRALQQQITNLRTTFTQSALSDPGEQPVRFALLSNYAHGDSDKALELLFMIQNSIDGVVESYAPTTKLLGAENRDKVTCYLDSVLFAMFARLGFFDAMLYAIYDDVPRQNLLVLVRLWVNMLRRGKLITTDITSLLQNALAECGWADAKRKRQQDASEAFGFIAEKLDLPLVTLKMAIFHNGKEDTTNDHRFINERLLQVAIPPPREDGESILLEDCLELYFNSHVEVRRYLDRRNTGESHSSDSIAKPGTSHVETIELNSPDSWLPQTPEEPNSEPSGPQAVKPRASSIVRRRFIPASDETARNHTTEDVTQHYRRSRKGSVRKEVMMPAWQMFSLIPWYTRHNQAFETATHFSSQRPILGICLKRYSVLEDGKAIRLDTKVDVPLEIALPHFIKDDSLTEDAPLYGQFKLRLQSVVCHQGKSVDSGHYISLVRGTTGTTGSAPNGHALPVEDNSKNDSDHRDHWLRFDDLAEERITLVDIEKALMDESPYILFYQITPLDDEAMPSDPPAYSESNDSPISRPQSSGLEKSNTDVIEYSLESGTGLDNTHFDKITRTVSTDKTHLDMSSPEDQSKSDHSSAPSIKEGARSHHHSHGSEGKVSEALAYLSGRKSTEATLSKETKYGISISNRSSLDVPKDKAKGFPSKRQLEELDRQRNRNFLKKHNKQSPPPERQCFVM